MIVIHIGLKKAGSTSLQAFLSNNEARLRTLAVDYPRIGRRLDAPAHHNIAREIVEGLKKFHPRFGTVSDLSDYWRDATGQSLVLSSELLEEVETQQAGTLRETLLRARGNEEFRIVMVIRDLLDQVPSSYAQKVKFGVKIQNFDEFFEERMQERRVSFFQTAERWARAFGWDAMHIRLLDRRYLVNEDLLDDFMAICGLASDAMQDPQLRRPGVSNVSPGWKVLEALRALFGGRHDLALGDPLTTTKSLKERQVLGNAAINVGNRRGWNDEKGRYLTRAQAQSCLDAYRASIEALNAHLPRPLPTPLDLDARGFEPREFLPDAVHIGSEELRSFFREVRALKLAKEKSGAKASRRSVGAGLRL